MSFAIALFVCLDVSCFLFTHAHGVKLLAWVTSQVHDFGQSLPLLLRQMNVRFDGGLGKLKR